MKIINMYRYPATGGNIKATFSIDFGILIVSDCKLVANGKGELWAAMPNRWFMKNGVKTFEGIVRIKDTEIMDVISNAAREVYEGKGAIDYVLKRTG